MAKNNGLLHFAGLLLFIGVALVYQTSQVQSAERDVSQSIQPVNPDGVTIPGLSQAMLVENGRLLFLSGHVPLNAEGAVPGDEIDAQLRQVFQNINATLQAANTDFSNVVRLTIYVRDFQPDQLALIRSVRDEFVATATPPASALIGVSALFRDDVRVEVDAIAVVP